MEDRDYIFQKLTPIDNANLKIYEEAFNFIFNNNDIKNVAVSGAYGSGKSSVIESYKKAHKDLQFLHISLAHFKSADNGNSESNISETILEGKIINQLIHQVDPKNIPQTNFKVKQKIYTRKCIGNTLIITAFLAFLAYIVFFDKWSTIISGLSVGWLKNILSWTTFPALPILSGFVCVLIGCRSIYLTIRSQKYRNTLRKIKLQSAEIEILEKNDDSLFDKYLNEVLYLFANSGSDVIVFEDMDRYNVKQIFERLREVNTLINFNRVKDKKEPIRFFYLLRDDIFISKDRTKFFDFILPIVPVIDGSNSYNQFIEHFKQGKIFELFDENFLQGLSLYVDDMRILKNIYNEFIIYNSRIQSTDLRSNKLLAIIVYKNLFPRDFSELQLGRGYVHTVFESKSKYICNEIESNNKKIQNIKELIQQTNDDFLDSVDELDAVYLITNRDGLSVLGNTEDHFKTRVEFIRAMKNNPEAVTFYNSYSGTRNYDIQEGLNKLAQNEVYNARKQAIERKNSDQIKHLQEDIQSLKRQISIIQNSRIKDLITKDNIDSFFGVTFTNEIGTEYKYEEIKESPYFDLIKYLIRNGYIDETYQDYMTYFYENSLSRIDKIFLRSVTDQLPKEYAYSLKDPKLVLSRLHISNFDQIEILNFDLFCYLLQNKERYNEFLSSFLLQLKVTNNFKFIGEFLELKTETNLFIEAINNIWGDVFECILSHSDFDEEQKKQYAINTFYYSSDEDIKVLDENGFLSKYISTNQKFLNIDNPNIEKIIHGLLLIDVRFTWIEYERSSNALFTAVYKNNLYQLTFNWISLILEVVYGYSESIDFKKKNYTMIISKPNEPLARYVEENINHYLTVYFDVCDNCIADEESAVLEILNNSEIEDQYKKTYISVLQTVITRLDDVNNSELWCLLLQRNLVVYTEDNILTYYFHSENGLDTFLVEFINGNNEELCFNTASINTVFGENATSLFFSSVVKCNKLSNERYNHILKVINWSYKSFAIQDISDEKILILINLRIIKMTAEVLLFMREYYPNQVLSFIVYNISKYVEIISDDNFDFNEMLLILEEQNVNDEYKIKLLQFTTEELSLRQKEYSHVVKIHILNHNLNVDDIPFLLSGYPKEGIDIRAEIKRISIEYITDIITEEYSIPFELLSELFELSNIEEDTKMKLFALHLPNMNEAQAKKCLRILQQDELLSLFDFKRPKFAVNDINRDILSIFQKKSWITKFEVDKDDQYSYRAYGRKKVSELHTSLLR
ncbi:hypothetical protein M3661_28385 [Paenibacillus sp. MER 180]|uniref:YobI family P-loop NTPase n=1 Tax=Paenibacillus sp. MER 180 TaxID=2939570 RepID=UPI00203CCFE2|nr:hypothetical protein [Paenibacillus sp. MER 180]MCM3294019.1 hypothetical protein [Paenibacillus sp. MER 180]